MAGHRLCHIGNAKYFTFMAMWNGSSTGLPIIGRNTGDFAIKSSIGAQFQLIQRPVDNLTEDSLWDAFQTRSGREGRSARSSGPPR
jgi:hypothetical protein